MSKTAPPPPVIVIPSTGGRGIGAGAIIGIILILILLGGFFFVFTTFQNFSCSTLGKLLGLCETGNAPVTWGGATFSTADISEARQITVPVGSTVNVFATVTAGSLGATGTLYVQIRKDVIFGLTCGFGDIDYGPPLSKSVTALPSQPFKVNMGTFAAIDTTGTGACQVREYFVKAWWDTNAAFYDPTDPNLREWVKTCSGTGCGGGNGGITVSYTSQSFSGDGQSGTIINVVKGSTVTITFTVTASIAGDIEIRYQLKRDILCITDNIKLDFAQTTKTVSLPSGSSQIAYTFVADDGPSQYSCTIINSGAFRSYFIDHLQVGGQDIYTDQFLENWSIRPHVETKAGTPSQLNVSFTMSDTTPDVGQVITFTGSATGGSGSYTFDWNFGDTTTGSGNPITHTYGSGGIYTITLTVTDTNGNTGSSQQSITAGTGVTPVTSVTYTSIQFTGGSQTGTSINVAKGTEVTITFTVVSDGDGDIEFRYQLKRDVLCIPDNIKLDFAQTTKTVHLTTGTNTVSWTFTADDGPSQFSCNLFNSGAFRSYFTDYFQWNKTGTWTILSQDGLLPNWSTRPHVTTS